jgi:hypothetical protein
MYGPLALAGLTDRDRYFTADVNNLSSWIKPIEDKPLIFSTSGQPVDVTFTPLNKVIHEQYGVYWVVTEEGSPRHQKILVEEEKRREYEEKMLDYVIPDNELSEAAHNLQGKNTASGHSVDGAWRHATSKGWWSWDFKVLPDTPMALLCTYWGSDVPPRTFDILVGGVVIATQSVDRNKPGQQFQVEYPIPTELTKGKEKITVRFQAHEGNTAGGVFGCAVLKPES